MQFNNGDPFSVNNRHESEVDIHDISVTVMDGNFTMTVSLKGISCSESTNIVILGVPRSFVQFLHIQRTVVASE